MKKIIGGALVVCCAVLVLQRCNKEELSSGTSAASAASTASALTDVIQTSAELASGTSFDINVVVDSTGTSTTTPGHNHSQGHQGCGKLDGTNLLAPTAELLAIIDAESAGDLRGMELHHSGGATVTNYDSAGNTISFTPSASGGQGCSFSGGQFPLTDAILAGISKTVIDFGTGVTQKGDSIDITRAGSITISRTSEGDTKTEMITFSNYTVNGIQIEGTKMRVTTLIKSGTSETGSSVTSVLGGKITFTDGSVATWTSDKKRNSEITPGTSGAAASGLITTEGATSVALTDGTVVYSHIISKTITEDIACRNHHGPVSGTVETVYRTNTLSIDFGDGSCANTTVTVTINGVTTTRTVGA